MVHDMFHPTKLGKTARRVCLSLKAGGRHTLQVKRFMMVNKMVVN